VKSAELEIRWPSGEWQTVPNVSANQLVTVKEGTGVVPSAGWSKG
jgi:ASPIC and UnbV